MKTVRSSLTRRHGAPASSMRYPTQSSLADRHTVSCSRSIFASLSSRINREKWQGSNGWKAALGLLLPKGSILIGKKRLALAAAMSPCRERLRCPQRRGHIRRSSLFMALVPNGVRVDIGRTFSHDMALRIFILISAARELQPEI